MSTRSTATFNAPLTSYAQGIASDALAANRLANILCPIVPVAGASGTFKKFDDRNSFLIKDSARPLGGPRTRLTHKATDGTYNCQPHGLEIGLDDFEQDLAANGGAQRMNVLAQGKIKSMVNTKALGYAKRVVDFVFANLTPVADRGNWSSANIDPLDQLDEQLEALATDVSSTENITLVMSVGGWRAIRSNAKVKARLGITGNMTLTREKFLDGLLFPVKLEVSGVSYVSTKDGQSAVAAGGKTQILSGYCVLNHATPNPTDMDPSAFKCFSTSSVLVDAVRTYREEQSNSDIHALDWSEDIVQTSSLSARLLALS